MAIENEDDRQLVERLFAKHRYLLFKRAYDILHDVQLAEDAVIETFLRVIRNLHKIEESNVSQTRGYLVIICDNVSKNYYKKRKKESPSEDDMQATAADNNPVEIVIRQDTIRRIAAAIEALPPMYRDILLLTYTHKHSHAEICEMLDIPLTTLKKRIQRARQKLGQRLKWEGLQ